MAPIEFARWVVIGCTAIVVGASVMWALLSILEWNRRRRVRDVMWPRYERRK